MGAAGRRVSFPDKEEIVRLNRRLLDRSKGEFIEPANLENSATLEWVLDAIEHPLFGQQMFPTLVEKAAALAWYIVRGHVFINGSKRTGMAAMVSFLQLNAFRFPVTDDEMVEMGVRVAEGSITKKGFFAWVRERAVPMFTLPEDYIGSGSIS